MDDVGESMVASFMEAWIEIYVVINIRLLSGSPPLWRRGLKF